MTKQLITNNESFNKYRKAYLQNVDKRNSIKWQVVLIFESPLEAEYSSRTAFFCEYTEATIYKKMLEDRYNELGFRYEIDVVGMEEE